MENKFIFPGTELNPNQKIVDAIQRRLVVTNGECPCDQGDVPTCDKMCPCKSYREDGYCCCKLYTPKDSTIIIHIQGDIFTSSLTEECSQIAHLSQYIDHLKKEGIEYIIKRR